MAGRVLAAFLLLFQLRPPSQQDPQRPAISVADAYGDPTDVELSGIAYATDSTRRQHVRTKGRLEMLATSSFFLLSDGGNRVLVILGHGLDAGEVRMLLGARVVARGIVRPLRKKEYVMGKDLDLIEDPMLPVMPAPDTSLPRVSLTLLSISDDEEPGRPRAKAAAGMVGQILAAPEGFLGKTVTVAGFFRGRNLFDDLPKGSQQGPEDWVLRDGANAAWIVGKAPRGKGFSLDPDSKNDSARHLEVTGKATVVNGIVYIKASQVQIAPRTTKAPAR